MPLFSARAEFGLGMTMRISIVFACACLAPLTINVAFSAGQPRQHNRAIADLDRAVQIDPAHAPVYGNRGWTHYVKHDYARALADLYRALNSAPEFYNRASMYFDTGDIQRALSDYSAAIRLDPSNALYYNDRGIVYQLMRDYEHALADYSRAIELNPTYVTAYNNRGMLYYGNKEYDRAIADHEQALKINPKSASAYRNLGNAHRAKGELDRAIGGTREAIRIDPKDARSYFGRERLYLYAGAPAKADDVWAWLATSLPMTSTWRSGSTSQGGAMATRASFPLSWPRSTWPPGQPRWSVFISSNARRKKSWPLRKRPTETSKSGSSAKPNSTGANFYWREITRPRRRGCLDLRLQSARPITPNLKAPPRS